MNPQLDNLADIVRERQAEMRRAAWTEQALRGGLETPRERLTLRLKFAVALAVVALLAFAMAQAVIASAGAGGGSGVLRVM
jgi:hypothetical protein